MKKALERTVQKAGEKLGSIEKTEYDPKVTDMITKIETGEQHLHKVCNTIECLLQPNANKRAGNAMYDKINRKLERVSPYQDFGQALKDFGEAMDKNSEYFGVIVKLGINEKLIGQVENELCDVLNKTFFFPLKDFIEQDGKRLHQEKELLEKKRIDYEIMKGKHSKANSGTPQYDKLSADLETTFSEFKQHQERLLKVLETIHQKLMSQKPTYLELVDRQIHFHTKSLEYLNYSRVDIMKLKD